MAHPAGERLGMNTRSFLFAAMVLIGVTAAFPALASAQPSGMDDPGAERPFRLLEQMARALETRHFEGTFVYQFGDSLSAMRIVHRHNDGVSQESLLTLDGPIRTIGRSGQAVACLLSGGQSVLLYRDYPSPAVEHPGPPDWRALAEHYRFRFLERSRVAGRAVDVVNIAPRDSLRYGYRFSIDRESKLPLRTALIDADGRIVQQVMFTDIRALPDQALPPAAAETSARSLASVEPGMGAEASAPAAAASSRGKANKTIWFFRELPDGFRLLSHDWMTSDAGSPLEYFLLGDGLASVSLYIERSGQPGLVGQTQMAAIHAAGKWDRGYQITAVGEVPAVTAQALIDTIDRGADDARGVWSETPGAIQQEQQP